jgi:hypothetical protein
MKLIVACHNFVLVSARVVRSVVVAGSSHASDTERVSGLSAPLTFGIRLNCDSNEKPINQAGTPATGDHGKELDNLAKDVVAIF